MRRTATTVLLAVTLLASACTGQAAGPEDVAAGAVVVADEPAALEAMADTLAGSLRWTGRLELTLDRDEVDAVMRELDAQLDEPLLPAAEQDWQAELDRLDEMARDLSTHGALADDGSWQVAVDHTGDTILDMRFGLGELLEARTTTPRATILARIGWDALLASSDEAADWDLRGAMRTMADDTDATDPFGDVLRALADGHWGGLAGPVDLGELGVAAEDLDTYAEQFRREVAGVADRDTMLELADRAMTVRDHTRTGDGLTVATVDLPPARCDLRDLRPVRRRHRAGRRRPRHAARDRRGCRHDHLRRPGAPRGGPHGRARAGRRRARRRRGPP